MKKMLVAALVVSVALLGAARPAKAGSTAGVILTGIAVGIGAAFLDALAPPPVVAAPAVIYPPAPVVVHAPPPVLYQPAPVIVHTPPPIIVTPAPLVYHAPPPIVYRRTPVVVHAPRHVIHRPHRSHHHGDHGKRHWVQTPRSHH